MASYIFSIWVHLNTLLLQGNNKLNFTSSVVHVFWRTSLKLSAPRKFIYMYVFLFGEDNTLHNDFYLKLNTHSAEIIHLVNRDFKITNKMCTAKSSRWACNTLTEHIVNHTDIKQICAALIHVCAKVLSQHRSRSRGRMVFNAGVVLSFRA